MKNCNGPPLRFFRRKNLKRKKNRKGGPLQHNENFVENEGGWIRLRGDQLSDTHLYLFIQQTKL